MGYWSREIMGIIHEAKRRNPAKNFIILDEVDLRKLIRLGKRIDEEFERIKSQSEESARDKR